MTKRDPRARAGARRTYRRSADAGRTWDEPRELARAGGASDHPLLLARGDSALLSWFGKQDGYRLLPLPRR